MKLKDFPQELIDSATELHLQKGEILVHEGAIPTHFYFILKGQIEMEKNAQKGRKYRISLLKKGDIIGEFGDIGRTKRSVSIKAHQPSTVLAFPLKSLTPKLEAELLPSLAREMAERLRYHNEITVVSLEKKLEEAKTRDLMAFVMVSLFSIFAIYIILLNTLIQSRNYSIYIFMALMIVLGGVAFAIVRRSGFPLATFGLTLKRWKHSALGVLPITLLLVTLTIGAKWVYIKVMGITTEPLINPLYKMVSFGNFLLFVSVYIVLVPMQEFLARGMLQSILTHLLSTERKRTVWSAILLSNLLFATLHTYVAIGLAITAFIPGVIWGWMYEKQRDLVGVSVSHIILGVWSFAILGFSHLF